MRKTRIYSSVLLVLALFLVTSVAAAQVDNGKRIDNEAVFERQVPPTATRTPTPINMGNFVWDDLDEDGRQDPGEPGLSGVVVQLWNSAKSNLLDSDVTDGNGNYTVIAPLPGNYRVRVVLPSASDEFSPKDQAGGDDTDDSDINPSGVNLGFTDIISIASNVISISNIDAGIIKFRTATPTRTPTPVNIGNFVWDDLDEDGRQDPGEPGLAGVAVQLWNSAKTDLLDTAVTDGNGIYTLQSAGPGQFRVRVVLPNINDEFSPKDQAGGDDTDDSDINPSGTNLGFTDIINIASNVISISNIDAGIIKFRTATPTRTPTPVNIGNFIWNDLDGDGEQDVGEPGISGVTVQLWNTAKTLLIDDAVTNGSGNYSLIAPTPGSYRIRVVLPNINDEFSPKDQAGGDDTDDSDINPSGVNLGFTDIVVIASNVISITSIDAGLIVAEATATPVPITVISRVWGDTNEDGLQGGGEPNVTGVFTRLYKVGILFDTVVDTAFTNASGLATLNAPGPGTYYVEFELPSGTSFTLQNVGADERFDSDPAPSGINQGVTDEFVFSGSPLTITTIDAGLRGITAPTSSPTATASSTATVTATPTASSTATASLTFTPSSSPTATETLDPSVSPTTTSTPTASGTATETSTASASPTATNTLQYTETPTATWTYDPDPLTDTPDPNLTPTVTPTDVVLIFATETATLTPPPPGIPCEYILPESAVQGRVLYTLVALYDPDPNTSTNVIIGAGTSWWVIGAQNGFYQLWITCYAPPVWVPAEFVVPNTDSGGTGAPLPDAGG